MIITNIMCRIVVWLISRIVDRIAGKEIPYAENHQLMILYCSCCVFAEWADKAGEPSPRSIVEDILKEHKAKTQRKEANNDT